MSPAGQAGLHRTTEPAMGVCVCECTLVHVCTHVSHEHHGVHVWLCVCVYVACIRVRCAWCVYVWCVCMCGVCVVVVCGGCGWM